MLKSSKNGVHIKQFWNYFCLEYVIVLIKVEFDMYWNNKSLNFIFLKALMAFLETLATIQSPVGIFILLGDKVNATKWLIIISLIIFNLNVAFKLSFFCIFIKNMVKLNIAKVCVISNVTIHCNTFYLIIMCAFFAKILG